MTFIPKLEFSTAFTNRRTRLARKWSNRILATIAPWFKGDVINVSAWEDSDKEGRVYRDYFSNATHYYTSNFGGERGESVRTDFIINLETELPPHLQGRFDVVFNHTTLEHVAKLFHAVWNLCAMTRDVVIVVVPFVQEVHSTGSFGDYWRFTHEGVRRLFETNALTVVALLSSPYPNAAIYHLAVATRHPERWKDHFAPLQTAPNAGTNLVRDSVFTRVASVLRDWIAGRLT